MKLWSTDRTEAREVGKARGVVDGAAQLETDGEAAPRPAIPGLR
jgi:hypothetical protein